MRDLRDPQKLGQMYLAARHAGQPIKKAVHQWAPDYEDGGYISSDPAQHHSKTPQTLGSLDDGGAS